jgi:hypothetical protein
MNVDCSEETFALSAPTLPCYIVSLMKIPDQVLIIRISRTYVSVSRLILGDRKE